MPIIRVCCISPHKRNHVVSCIGGSTGANRLITLKTPSRKAGQLVLFPFSLDGEGQPGVQQIMDLEDSEPVGQFGYVGNLGDLSHLSRAQTPVGDILNGQRSISNG